MSNQFHSDDELLAQLIRDAGDPTVSPDPLYAKTLQATILDRVGSAESVVAGDETVRQADAIDVPVINLERARIMKRIIHLAIAATILIACGIVLFEMTIGGGSGNIAFAEIAKALDSLQSVTYDFTSEIKNPVDGKTTTTNSKGYFLAPALERVETSLSIGPAKDKGSSIMILDCLAAKGIVLDPQHKKAMIINISTTETSTGGTANMFEMVRRLVREESTDSGEKVESLGQQEIDGRIAVGFRARSNMADMTLWADPQTARLVRVDYDNFSGSGRAVMSNFRYDMELEPSLFSLEPPAGYTVDTQTVTRPTEEDLVNVLRFIAEHNAGTFPDSLGTNDKTFMLALQAEAMSESQKLLEKPEVQERMQEVMAQYGEDKEGGKKAWMKEWMEMAGPITQKHTQKYLSGAMFYATLQPENDSHYAGGGVKLGTPNRPICWYQPTGADKYRVIYADLSVKEVAPEDVNDFPSASESNTAQKVNIDEFVQGEKHLIEMLRIYAAEQKGLLPPTLSAHDIQSGTTTPLEKEIKAKYGTSPEAMTKTMQDPEFKRWMSMGMKCSQGLSFLRGLKPESDSTYAGKDVKLGTPNRPIFWYQPTGADKYRVIYADLSIKEMEPENVEKLPAAEAE